jgi:hypothetical protein
VEAAKQFVEQGLVYARTPGLLFEGEQVTAHERQVLVALGEVVVEELREKFTAVGV